jgi:hypothetical protein
MGVTLPALIPIPRVRDVLGLSRTTAYREVAAGRLELVKVGKSAFITGASASAYIATLPRATIRADRKAA